MWVWLKRSTNQKTLALIGSGIAAVAIAVWTVYAHFYPNKPGGSTPSVQVEGGVGAGGDISVGGDIKINKTAEPGDSSQ